MVNITQQSNTLRKAIASAVVSVSRKETIEAVLGKTVPKGDVFEFSRAAGLLGIKKTSDLIPDCHPLPVEFASITYSIEGLNIIVTVEVHTVYKTGVEVEAMHGASISALTIYDMLKPLDNGIEISSIKLVSKKGGKTYIKKDEMETLQCAVVICSDTVASGNAKDSSGIKIEEKLRGYNLNIGLKEIIPDDFTLIQSKALAISDAGYDLLLFTGGTGLSPRDLTPDAIRPLLDKEIPGIMETARSYGQQRMPYAMLSRGVAGFIKDTLVITLPGSPRGVEETMDAIFPHVLHVFRVREGIQHSS